MYTLRLSGTAVMPERGPLLGLTGSARRHAGQLSRRRGTHAHLAVRTGKARAPPSHAASSSWGGELGKVSKCDIQRKDGSPSF